MESTSSILGPDRIGFVFGDRAIAAIEENDLPVKIIGTLKSARKYPEGRSIQVEVKQPVDVQGVIKLLQKKTAI